MPAKTPIYLKTAGKGGGGSKGSRKLREVLSADMISPPLGDFRHTAHVGRGGSDDMFGDTSFLKNDSNSSWNSMSKLSAKRSSDQGAISYHPSGSRTLGRNKIRKGSCNSSDDGLSLVMQSASSLPHLSTGGITMSGELQTLSCEPLSQDYNQIDSRCLESVNVSQSEQGESPSTTATGGPPKPRRILSVHKADVKEEPPVSTSTFDTSLKMDYSEDESWKFDFDLGPPLMDEIMGIINKPESGL